MYHTKADCANIHNNNCTKEKIAAEKILSNKAINYIKLIILNIYYIHLLP